MQNLKFRTLAATLGIAILTSLAQGADSQKPAAAHKAAAPTGTGSRVALGGVPLAFEANRGQAANSVKFFARGDGYSVALSDNAAILRSNTSGQMVRMNFPGAAQSPKQEALALQSYKTNYFVGSDASKWVRNVQSYGRVRFDNIYPGIAVDFHGQGRRMEYDFTVQPGSDPKQIRMAFDGASNVRLTPAGDLIIDGVFVSHKPSIYQQRGNSTLAVEGRYSLKGSEVGFEIAKYDATLPLVIDPLVEESTYVGGSGPDDITKIQVDDPATSGCGGACGFYVVGTTQSPTDNSWASNANPVIAANLPGTVRNSTADVFVAKLTLTGDSFAYIAIYGGNGDDVGTGLAIRNGVAYVTGTTQSPNLPLVNAFQPTFQRGNPSPGSTKDAFIFVLNAAGNALTGSSYIGGGDDDSASGITLDSTGNAYIIGTTKSANLLQPGIVANAFQQTINQTNTGGTNSDAFVVRISPLFVEDYGTYFGGGAVDSGKAIAVDSTGFYITGQTNSFSGGAQPFPIAPVGTGVCPNGPPACLAFAPFLPGGSAVGDAFLAKIDPTQVPASQLKYSTYIGSNLAGNSSAGAAIVVDSVNQAWVAGTTTTFANFTSSGGSANPSDVGTIFSNYGNLATSGIFLAKFNPAGVRMQSLAEQGANGAPMFVTDLKLDSSNQAYMTGYIAGLAAVADTQAASGPANVALPAIVQAAGLQQGFFERFTIPQNFLNLNFLTYTNSGAANNQRTNSVAVLDSQRNAYLGGTTDAAIPNTVLAYQPSSVPQGGNFFASADFTFAGPVAAAPIWSGGGPAGEGYVYAINFNDAVASPSPAANGPAPVVFNLQQAVTVQAAAATQTITFTYSDPGFGSVPAPTVNQFQIIGVPVSVRPIAAPLSPGLPGITCTSAAGVGKCIITLNTNPAVPTDFTSLVPGQYQGFLQFTIASDDSFGFVPVVLNIIAPALRTVPVSLTYALNAGQASNQNVDVQVTPPPAPATAVDIPFTAVVTGSPFPVGNVVVSGVTGTTAGTPNFNLAVTVPSTTIAGQYNFTVHICPAIQQVPFNNPCVDMPVTVSVGTPGIPPFANIGVFRGGFGFGLWVLDRNSNYTFDSGIDSLHFFGLPPGPAGSGGDIPVVGDWTGNGTARLGVFRCPPAATPGACNWFVDLNNNGKWDGVAGGDGIYTFGLTGDMPVVGDWVGNGNTKIGIFRCGATTCQFVLDVNNNHTFDVGDAVDFFGLPGDTPVIGQWGAGASIADGIGVFRCGAAAGSPCQWIVDSNGDGAFQSSDAIYVFGATGDVPVVGDWDDFGAQPTGRKRIGVFRTITIGAQSGIGTFVLDSNGNNAFDSTDQVVYYGQTGDIPVVGNWPLGDVLPRPGPTGP